jgi:hypothetical protein
MTSEAQRLREQAARCLRLAKNYTLPEDVLGQMRAMAADCLERARALEQEPEDQQQQQIGNVVLPPEPSHGAAQQQQQIQSEKPDGDE